MTRALFLLSTVLFWASTTFASSGSLEEYGVGNKAQLTTNTTYRFMTWNIYKGGKYGFYEDYSLLIDQMDFVATQEFLLNQEQEEMITLKQNNHWGFAKSFESGSGWTGVATISKWQPTSSVPVMSPGTEPFAGTPKMSMISTYAIEDGRVLMLVNMHCLNFNLSHGDFKDQVDDVIQRIQSHQGPLIFAGDFNTWASARLTYLLKKTESVGLKRLDLENGVGITGNTLDHIFVREVNVSSSQVMDDFNTSDHLPLMMEFSL